MCTGKDAQQTSFVEAERGGGVGLGGTQILLESET